MRRLSDWFVNVTLVAVVVMWWTIVWLGIVGFFGALAYGGYRLAEAIL